MKIPFTKYQGTGNDFVIIDNRKKTYLQKKDTAKIKQICDRKFGIGADGLILLEEANDYDFRMVYFNADGNESTMCGNGGRCIVAFAKDLSLINRSCRFIAIDGPHEATLNEAGDWVNLQMGEVGDIEIGADFFILDTGSPHYVIFVEDINDINVVENGQAIRYSDRFKKEGINVNFVEKTPSGITVATYERGVEDETLSCGTGVTAAALSYYIKSHKKAPNTIAVETKGGNLEIKFNFKEGVFKQIQLCGPAIKVFTGVIEI